MLSILQIDCTPHTLITRSMIQRASIASHLAVRIARPVCHRANISNIYFPGFQSIPKYISTITRHKPIEHFNTVFSKRLPFNQTIRHCSHQRNMCKAHEGVMSGSMDVTKGREVLPKNVKPIHYDLTLEPDFEKFTYEGTVIIEYVYFRVCGNIRKISPLQISTIGRLTVSLKPRGQRRNKLNIFKHPRARYSFHKNLQQWHRSYINT